MHLLYEFENPVTSLSHSQTWVPMPPAHCGDSSPLAFNSWGVKSDRQWELRISHYCKYFSQWMIAPFPLLLFSQRLNQMAGEMKMTWTGRITPGDYVWSITSICSKRLDHWKTETHAPHLECQQTSKLEVVSHLTWCSRDGNARDGLRLFMLCWFCHF